MLHYRREKVLVAMSGGVDSSVAAALLLRKGYDVVGCFMRLGSPGEALDELRRADGIACAPGGDRGEDPPGLIRIGRRGCCSIHDAADARLVAARLGIPFYVCNFRKDFGRIIDYFVEEYNAGRTPNPCVRCNDWLKFGRLRDYARQIGAEYLASGHHARIDRTDRRRPRLLRGADREKDQSYVLFGTPRERLAAMLLPIGEHHKSEVRRLAAEFDLPVLDKPESQEICFVPDNDYAGLVRRRSPGAIEPGRVVDTAGTVLGEHEGHQHFTVGQRRGVGIALGHPVYVVHKDARANTITVGEKAELQSRGCMADGANWLADPQRDWINCTAKIRYNAEPAPARVRAHDEGVLNVRFEEPQFAIAPGQAVVCYDDDMVLCGGWIRDVL
jgi:tRNA-specific 2-thiouridylase